MPAKKDGDYRVVVYEDFVSQYDIDGKKVNNLVMTVFWRDEAGILQHKYIDNFCADRTIVVVKGKKKKHNRCDAYFVINAWELHLGLKPDDGTSSGEFDGVTHILRTGDSGPHFHCRKTMAFEAHVQTTHNIHWETHTLCKRHAYILCDAHGGQSKVAAAAAAIAGAAPMSALDFANIINICIANAKAYCIENIDRKQRLPERCSKLVWIQRNLRNKNIRWKTI